MASVQASAEEVTPHLDPYGDRVSIAAQNGPRATVLSGEPEAIEELIGAFEAKDIRARLIAVGYASHCAQISSIEAELKEAIKDIVPTEAEIPFYSTLSGEQIQTTSLDAEYWYRNLREPVRFHQATQRLLRDGTSAFVEMSAHPVLSLALSETTEAEGKQNTLVLHTLRREEGGARRFYSSLAEAHAHGLRVSFDSLLKDSGATNTELPTYPFQRQRYWLEASRGTGDLSAAGQSATEHPLLAASIPLAQEGAYLLTGRISQADHPWLADHAVAATAILPGTAFCELALRAGREVGATHLRELLLEAPLAIPAEGALQLQLTLTPQEETETYEVIVHARPEPSGEEGEEGEPVPFTRHASATLTEEAPQPLGFDATLWPPPGAEALSADGLYERLAEAGLEYGPAFQGVEAAWRDGADIYAEVSLATEQESEAGRYAIHPALLDAAIHPAFLAAEGEQGTRLPFAFAGVSAHATEGPSALRVRLTEAEGRLTIEAADAEGNPVALRRHPRRPRGRPRPARLAPQGLRGPVRDRVGGGGIARRLPRRRRGARADPLSPPRPRWIRPAATRRSRRPGPRAPAGRDRQDPRRGEAPVTPRLPQRRSRRPRSLRVRRPRPAAAWGLVRSAQSEHPGRFTLIDTDGSEASEAALARRSLSVAERAAAGPARGNGPGGAAGARRRRRRELAPPEPAPGGSQQGARGTLEELALVAGPRGGAPARSRARCGSRCAPPASTSATS